MTNQLAMIKFIGGDLERQKTEIPPPPLAKNQLNYLGDRDLDGNGDDDNGN